MGWFQTATASVWDEMNVTDGDNCAHTCVQSLPEGIHAVVRVKSCGKSCLVRQMRTNLLPRAASLLLHRKVALKIPASESCGEKDFQMQSDKQLPLWRLGVGGGCICSVWHWDIRALMIYALPVFTPCAGCSVPLNVKRDCGGWPILWETRGQRCVIIVYF